MKTEIAGPRRGQLLEALFLTILILYPLRHIHWGLDLMDTAYNYANFQYMGLEHMDSMWLFSTYLANAVGSFLTMLPFAGGLVGMNFYTGLFVSLLSVMGYLFCTRKLGIASGIAFAGEMAAISLCWCPTSLLYNYLTYVFFLGAVILLYKGLVQKKMYCLFAAGICLGINVLVRFSNLPEAGMIVAVWAYAFIEKLESKKAGNSQAGQGGMKQAFQHTLWCLGGYLSALLILLGYIHIRYGLEIYVEGMQRLFGMTESATDYKATAMVMKLVTTYVENLYWIVRIAVFPAVGMVILGFCELIFKRCKTIGEHTGIRRAYVLGRRLLCALLAGAMLLWLYSTPFCSLNFNEYNAMLRPGILFMILTMLIGVINIFHRNTPKEEKLISGMLILIIVLTSIGSNNGVFPSLNNLFLAAPYTLYQCGRFIRNREIRYHSILLPAKCILAAFMLMFFVQILGFGTGFVFVEGAGATDVTETVDNNQVLAHVKMSPERAKWMEEISAYVAQNNLQGREVILYGNIPSLSYYLQMPSAFNPWSDLLSYSQATMERDMASLQEEMDAGGEIPVIIAEHTYAAYLEGGAEGLQAIGVPEKRQNEVLQDGKWDMLVAFMQNNGYAETFSNEKFTIWEADLAR